MLTVEQIKGGYIVYETGDCVKILVDGKTEFIWFKSDDASTAIQWALDRDIDITLKGTFNPNRSLHPRPGTTIRGVKRRLKP